MLLSLSLALAGDAPVRSSRDLRVALEEVRVNTDAIRDRELSYFKLYKMYQPCSTPEEARERGKAFDPTRWEGGGCWKLLAYNDPGLLRGGYWVTLAADGSGFEVHGVIDADGDGTFAEYVATHDLPATPLTPADEY